MISANNRTITCYSGNKKIKQLSIPKIIQQEINAVSSFKTAWHFNTVAFSKNKVVAGTDMGRTLYVWSSTDGKYLGLLQGHQDIILQIKTLGDDMIISASADQTIRVWSLQNMSCLKVLNVDGAVPLTVDGRIRQDNNFFIMAGLANGSLRYEKVLNLAPVATATAAALKQSVAKSPENQNTTIEGVVAVATGPAASASITNTYGSGGGAGSSAIVPSAPPAVLVFNSAVNQKTAGDYAAASVVVPSAPPGGLVFTSEFDPKTTIEGATSTVGRAISAAKTSGSAERITGGTLVFSSITKGPALYETTSISSAVHSISDAKSDANRVLQEAFISMGVDPGKNATDSCCIC